MSYLLNWLVPLLSSVVNEESYFPFRMDYLKSQSLFIDRKDVMKEKEIRAKAYKNIENFLEELKSKYPQADRSHLSGSEDYPWHIDFNPYAADRLMPIVYSKTKEATPLVASLAEKYGIVCFETDSNKVCLPKNRYLTRC